jgi:hypothetical protein
LARTGSAVRPRRPLSSCPLGWSILHRKYK